MAATPKVLTVPTPSQPKVNPKPEAASILVAISSPTSRAEIISLPPVSTISARVSADGTVVPLT